MLKYSILAIYDLTCRASSCCFDHTLSLSNLPCTVSPSLSITEPFAPKKKQKPPPPPPLLLLVFRRQFSPPQKKSKTMAFLTRSSRHFLGVATRTAQQVRPWPYNQSSDGLADGSGPMGEMFVVEYEFWSGHCCEAHRGRCSLPAPTPRSASPWQPHRHGPCPAGEPARPSALPPRGYLQPFYCRSFC